MSTFILPFDHRSGFAKDIMGTSYPFSPADRQRAQDLKGVIFDAFLEARRTYMLSDTLGILVDEETGSSFLHTAHSLGILSLLTLEASGEPSLRLQYGDRSAARIRSTGASLGKVLLRFSSLPDRNDRQLVTLQQLHAQLTRAGYRLLVELLSPGSTEDREAFLLHTIALAQDMGIVPEFWKVEMLPSVRAWERVRGITHPSSGILVLGRGEDRHHVEEALRIAGSARSSHKKAVDGFAIGRTLFADELRKLLAGTLSRQDAVSGIAHQYSSMMTLWNSL